MSDAAEAASLPVFSVAFVPSCSNSNPDFLRGKSRSAPSRVHRVNRGWEKHLNKDAHDAQDSGGIHRDEGDEQDKTGWVVGVTMSNVAEAASLPVFSVASVSSCSNSNPDFLRGESRSAPNRVHRVNRGWEKHLNKDAHDAQDSGGGFTGMRGMNRIKGMGARQL
jgi:hypothetical protein